MITCFWLLVIFLSIAILAYNRASAIVSSIGMAVVLLFITVFSSLSMIILTITWLLWFCYLVVFNKTRIRKKYLSNHLLTFYQKVTPSMSKTEEEAIAAGTVHWAGELFSGAPNWQSMLEKPKATLSAEEKAFLDGPTEELCKMLDDWEISHKLADLPKAVWDFIKANKFFAMIIPKAYGGLEFSAVANSTVVMKIAAVSPTAASIICVPNSLGPGELLLKYGTEAQKNHYLPRLAEGQEIPCFALTGPYAGSDATSIPDIGVVCKQQHEGKEVLGLRLNFNKRYITLAPVATVIGLAFKMYDPDHLLGDKEEYGITCALIPRTLSGISIGRRHFPLNNPFQNGPIQGENVFIPLDYIIGGVEMAGHGWTMLVECLSVGRGISLPAMATGGAKLGIRAGGAYSRIREQFGLPIGKFEGVEEVLARAVANTYVMDSTRLMTIAAIARGEKPSVLTAIAKLHITELGRKVCMDIMDIHGGKGICLGPNNYLGRGYQAVPISITVEGANILTRSMIVFGQGAIRCHPYVLKEMQLMKNSDKKALLTNFDKTIFAHIGFITSNIFRSLILGLTSSQVVLVPRKNNKRYYQHLTRFSSAFALLADISMAVLGGNLKRKECLSARLGDILSHLCMASAVLKRFEDDACPKADKPIVDYAIQSSLFHIQNAFKGVLQNFPNTYVAAILRFLIFPVGAHFKMPKDKLNRAIAKSFLEPSETRDRLTKYLCVSEQANYPLGRIDKTLELVIAIAPLEKKIKLALKSKQITGRNFSEQLQAALDAKVISEDEFKQIEEAHAARMELINVDDFSGNELATEKV